MLKSKKPWIQLVETNPQRISALNTLKTAANSGIHTHSPDKQIAAANAFAANTCTDEDIDALKTSATLAVMRMGFNCGVAKDKSNIYTTIIWPTGVELGALVNTGNSFGTPCLTAAGSNIGVCGLKWTNVSRDDVTNCQNRVALFSLIYSHYVQQGGQA